MNTKIKNQLLARFPSQQDAVTSLAEASTTIRPPIIISSPCGCGAIASVVLLTELLSETPNDAKVHHFDMGQFSNNADHEAFLTRLETVTRLCTNTSCILLDEIEKSAPSLLKVIELLVVDGIVILNDGTVLDVKNIRLYLTTHFPFTGSDTLVGKFSGDFWAKSRLVNFKAVEAGNSAA